MGPPPPPLPPPLKASSHNHNSLNNQLLNNMMNAHNGAVVAGGETFDSDSGMEVVEEPTLRPSELVRGNHNRTMSTISGKFLMWQERPLN